MALWGIAKTFSRWGTPDVEQLKRGWKEIKVAKSLHAKTAREKAYIGAVAALYEPPERTDEWKSSTASTPRIMRQGLLCIRVERLGSRR
jgi:hypothetical protein